VFGYAFFDLLILRKAQDGRHSTVSKKPSAYLPTEYGFLGTNVPKRESRGQRPLAGVWGQRPQYKSGRQRPLAGVWGQRPQQRCLIQRRFEVRVIFDLIPADGKARAVAAEDGVRRIIGEGLVLRGIDHRLRILARRILRKGVA